jgi:uncharacterized protein YggE
MYYNQPLSPFPAPVMPQYRTMYAQPQASRSSPSRPHTIEVSGEGTVAVAPDKAVVELGAITENASLTVAQNENAQAVSRIVAALEQLGIPKEQIQTSNYRIDMEYDYTDGKQTLRGYRVTHLLQITTHQVNQTGLIIDTAVRHGANSVSNVQFMVARPEAYYNQALSLALKNGELKALTIAKTIGVTLHPYPVQVQEVPRTMELSPYQTKLYAQSAATPIQPGELKISAAIRAEYVYC